MADERCLRQTTTIQPQARLATNYDQADISSKSDCLGFSHQLSIKKQQKHNGSKYRNPCCEVHHM
jgi:hypothetical protein